MTEFKILNISEVNNRLVVEVEKDNQINKYSFPISYKDNHYLSGKPYFLHKLKKYFDRDKERKIKKVNSVKHLINKSYNIDDIEDMSNKAIRKLRHERQKNESDIVPDKLLEDEYKKIHLELKEKHDKVRFIRDASNLLEFQNEITKEMNTICSISKQPNRNLTK